MYDTNLVSFMQQIRDHFEREMRCNSVYRCKAHNKAVGGTGGSYHMKGMAADIYIAGVAPRTIAQYAESIGVPGIILYDTFVHIDTRPNKYRGINKNGKLTNVGTFGGTPAPSGKIDEDGKWGKGTTRRLQAKLGTVQDGEISKQLASQKNNLKACMSGFSWKGKKGDGGSLVIRALQKLVGAPQDGHLGPETIRLMQKYFGTTVDGKLSAVSACVKAMQKWLNQ
ncbi:D-Ala-D-Ala carboxypeptidase family metallohydrolase [Eubacteriales bacterium OttesenSCG-928-M02]|nr:D-Ala-D-Ala carboxypeptidase family metallohydrolase [Eubacteriales bacterium OttesenSCG-928-M02]